MENWKSEQLLSGVKKQSKATRIFRGIWEVVLDEINNERLIRQARKDEDPNPYWRREMKDKRNKELAFALIAIALSAGAGATVALICNNQVLEGLMR